MLMFVVQTILLPSTRVTKQKKYSAHNYKNILIAFLTILQVSDEWWQFV